MKSPFVFFFFVVALGIEQRALHLISIRSLTELVSQPAFYILL